MYSTFESRKLEPYVGEAPSRPTTSFNPIPTRVTEPRGEVGSHFPRKTSFDHRIVRSANFQKWVKKYNGSGDLYDHLESFKKVSRAEQVTNLHTKAEGFGKDEHCPSSKC